MPRHERGTILARGKSACMVWDDTPTELVILPIEDGPALPHDVLVEDTLALGFAMKNARLRAQRKTVGRSRQRQVGTLPRDLVCKVSLAVARHFVAAREEAKWTLGAVHRSRALAENLPATR